MTKLVIFDLDDTLFDTTNQLDTTYVNLPFITLYPGASDVLRYLNEHKIASVLVTLEKTPDLQQKKIDLLDIEQYLDDVFICRSPEEKHMLFEQMFSRFGISDPKEVIVVGDRIDLEIMFGNILGCTTVQLYRGRHKERKVENKHQVATHVIQSIDELINLL